MRWEELFDDLEARFAEQERAETESDLIGLVRAERDRIAFVDRLRAHQGAAVTLDLRDGSSRQGTVVDVGKDWLLIQARAGGHRGSDLIVPLGAVVSAGGLSQLSLGEGASLVRRLRLNTVLRGLVRDRAGVAVDFWPTGRLDGTIDRVGADHLDLAVHPPDVVRRPGEVRQMRTVPFQAIAAVGVR